MYKYSFYEYITKFETENITWFKIIFGPDLYLLDHNDEIDIYELFFDPLDIVKLNSLKMVFEEYIFFLDSTCENIGR